VGDHECLALAESLGGAAKVLKNSVASEGNVAGAVNVADLGQCPPPAWSDIQ